MSGNKNAAIEMSIGTIVTIVLAMSMLILGMVLVKNIFSGSSSNVLQMNDQVKGQINKLFTEDKRTVVNLPNQIAKIKQNEEWGVSFGVQNLARGTADSGIFAYEIVVAAPEEVTRMCGISDKEVMSWVGAGRVGKDIPIAPGETYLSIVRFIIPDTAPLCIVRFNLKVTKEGKAYATDFFDVEVLP